MIPPIMKEVLLKPWQVPPVVLQLQEGLLHVWRAHVPTFAPWIHLLEECLSPEERRLTNHAINHHEKIARILGRATRRILISNYTGIPAARLTFSRSALGKPQPAPATGLSHIRFNVSHSKDWLAFAVGNRLKVGVDLEYIDENFPAEEIATRFFTAKETAAIHDASAPQRNRLFFDIWVRKEAYLKAVGRGLLQQLNSFEVPTDSRATISANPEKDSDTTNEKESLWLFRDIHVAPDYAAAVVTCPPPLAIHLFDWNLCVTRFF